MAEAPTYVASKLLEFGTRTSMEIEKPAGSKEGDILCIFPYVEVNGKVISISGATEITPQAQSGTTFRQGAFWLVHDGTAAKIKVTWEGSESKGCACAIDAWRGANQKTPIDVTSVLTAFSGTKTPEAPSITTTTDQTTQVVMEVNSAGTLLNKTPTGFTLRTNYSPATVSRVREKAEATGKTALELTASKTGLVMSFALKPAEVSAVTITPPPAIAIASVSVPVPKVSISPPAASASASASPPVPKMQFQSPAASAIATVPPATPRIGIAPPAALAVATATAPAIKGPKPKAGNLIANPGFEAEKLDWSPISSSTISRTTEEARSGAASLKVVCTSHSSFEGAVHGITEDFTPGERYQYVAWVKGPIGKSLRIRLEDDKGRNETFFEGTGDWRRVSVRRTIDPAATFVQIGVHVGGTQTTTFYVDDVDLELAPTEFTGNWESGDLSEWDLIQAIPGRITVIKVNPGQGRYCGRFEVQEGDVEPATGSNRAEVQSGLEYEEGHKRFFKARFRIPHVSWDWGHWGLIWQAHDNSSESPPLCWMLGQDPKTGIKYIALQSGDGKHIYCTIEDPPDDEWFTLIWAIEFGKEGTLEVWRNGSQSEMSNGKTVFEEIDTLGKPLAYDKLGIYRSSESKGTGVVYHDDYLVSKTFPPLPTVSRVAVTREFPPDRLAVRIADPTTGQTITRWAEDEGKPENTISGITKSGEMNGGHKEMGGSLPRDPRVDWPDTETYFDVYLEQPGGENIWEGRLNGAPESDGERMVLEPKAVGHQAALEDRKGLRLGFIDCDLSKWGEPSTQRRLNLNSAGNRLNAAVNSGWQDAGEHPPGVSIDFAGIETVTGKVDRGEATYYGGGIDIGALLYHFVKLAGGSGPEWQTIGVLSTDDIYTVYEEGTNHQAGTNSSEYERLNAAGAGRKYAALISARSESGAGGEVLGDLHSWECPKVLANLNLALQGTWPNVGYTAKQMLELAIPLYSYLEAQDEDLEDDGYIISQAWYSDLGDMATVVKDLTKYSLLRWFVLNGKHFELRAPGTFGRNWQAYAGPSELKEAGEDGSRQWDRLVVSYRDVDGTTKTVGYLGSGADTESAQLEIKDPDHPAVKAGRPREDLLSLNGISTPERALEAGERWLQEGNELSHAGEATLRGYIQDDRAVFRPVAQIQPGDRMRFPDAGSGGTGYREVVAINYDHDSRTASVNLDAPPNAIEALLERLDASIRPLGLS